MMASPKKPHTTPSSSTHVAPSSGTTTTTTTTTGISSQVTTFPPLKIELKYRVALPDLPFEPKFMTVPMSDEFITKYRETTLERSYKYKLHAFPPPLPDCDLIDPFTSELYAKSVVLDERDRNLTRKDAIEKQTVSVRATHLEDKPWLVKTVYLAPNELKTEGPTFASRSSASAPGVSHETALLGDVSNGMSSNDDGNKTAGDKDARRKKKKKNGEESDDDDEDGREAREKAKREAEVARSIKVERIEREFEIANVPLQELLAIIAKSDNPKLKRKLTVRRTFPVLPAEAAESWKRAKGMELFQVRFDPGEGLEEDDVAKLHKESIEREEHSFLVRRVQPKRGGRGQVNIMDNEFTPLAFLLPRLVPGADGAATGSGGGGGSGAGDEEQALGEEEEAEEKKKREGGAAASTTVPPGEDDDLFADEDAEPIVVPGESEGGDRAPPRKPFDATRVKTVRDYTVKTSLDEPSRAVLLLEGGRVLFRHAQRTTLRMYRAAKRPGGGEGRDEADEQDAFVPGFASASAHARGAEGNVPVHLRPFSDEGGGL